MVYVVISVGTIADVHTPRQAIDESSYPDPQGPHGLVIFPQRKEYISFRGA